MEPLQFKDGHLELLLAVLHSFNFTLCEAETSLKWTQRSPSQSAYQNSELHTRFLFVCASLFCFMLFVRLIFLFTCSVLELHMAYPIFLASL